MPLILLVARLTRMSDRARALQAFQRGDLDEAIAASLAILRHDLEEGQRVDAARQLLTIGAAHHMRRDLEGARVWYRRAIGALEILVAGGRVSMAPALASARVMLRAAEERPWHGDRRAARRLIDLLPTGPSDRIWVRTARACLLPTLSGWAHEAWLVRMARHGRAIAAFPSDRDPALLGSAVRQDLALVLLGHVHRREDVALELFRLGVAYENEQDDAAERWYSRSATAIAALVRTGRVDLLERLARCLGRLALCQRRLLRTAEARANIRAARRVRRAAALRRGADPADCRTARLAQDRADLLGRLGEHEAAMAAWLEAAELLQARIEEGRPHLGYVFTRVVRKAFRSLRSIPLPGTRMRWARRLVRLLDRPALAAFIPGQAGEAWETLAASLHREGRLGEARRLHELAIRRAGGEGELAARAWRNLGLLHELAGDRELAIRAHREALAIVEARILAGWLGEVAGHVKSTLRLLALLDRPGEDVEALAGRAFALCERVSLRRAELPPAARWAVLEFLAEASRRGWRPGSVRRLAEIHVSPG